MPLSPELATLNTPSLKAQKRQIRREKRRARRALNAQQRRRASLSLARRIRASLPFMRARHIALYWPLPEEIDPTALLHTRAMAAKKLWYLPVITSTGMNFYNYTPGATLRANRYGVPEPATRGVAPVKPWMLDLVIVPLVSFDRQLTRLGMGGGFYDRYFEQKQPALSRPYFLGVGFECQASDQDLPREPWDIVLDAVVTEEGWY